MSPRRAGASAATAGSPSSSTAAPSGSVDTPSPAWTARCRSERGGGVAMAKFQRNEIISLIGPTPRYDLGESVGPDLSLREVLGSSAQESFDDMALGYGSAQGDPRLRGLIADAHRVSADAHLVSADD